MKKTSAYSRKRRPGHSYNGAAWVNVIQRCAAYGELDTIAGFDVNTGRAADLADAKVTGALESLMLHQQPGDVEKLFDTLAHAVGVGIIRALQIQPDESKNPMIPSLNKGTEALRRAIERWNKARHFGLDAAGRIELPEAIDAYLIVLRNSSPAQMEKATAMRMMIVEKANKT